MHHSTLQDRLAQAEHWLGRPVHDPRGRLRLPRVTGTVRVPTPRTDTAPQNEGPIRSHSTAVVRQRASPS
ncbi:hypothetical protein [Streptomyces scopuliridis]|uniref:hypothetical protein n=1 Tax=Streptomyces scopuliridis TaxID=452529 RepID=UPI0036816D36